MIRKSLEISTFQGFFHYLKMLKSTCFLVKTLVTHVTEDPHKIRLFNLGKSDWSQNGHKKRMKIEY